MFRFHFHKLHLWIYGILDCNLVSNCEHLDSFMETNLQSKSPYIQNEIPHLLHMFFWCATIWYSSRFRGAFCQNRGDQPNPVRCLHLDAAHTNSRLGRGWYEGNKLILFPILLVGKTNELLSDRKHLFRRVEEWLTSTQNMRSNSFLSRAGLGPRPPCRMVPPPARRSPSPPPLPRGRPGVVTRILCSTWRLEGRVCKAGKEEARRLLGRDTSTCRSNRASTGEGSLSSSSKGRKAAIIPRIFTFIPLL